MTMYLFLILASMIAAAAVAVFCDWRWPMAPRRRLVLLSGLILPLVILIACPLFLMWALRGRADPAEVDASGMIIATVMFAGGSAVLLSLIFGLSTAHFVIRFLRKS